MDRTSTAPTQLAARARTLLALLLLLAHLLCPGLHHVLTPHAHCGGHAACEHGGVVIDAGGDAQDPHVADACLVCDLLLAGRHWLPWTSSAAPRGPEASTALREPGRTPVRHVRRAGQPPARGPPSWS